MTQRGRFAHESARDTHDSTIGIVDSGTNQPARRRPAARTSSPMTPPSASRLISARKRIVEGLPNDVLHVGLRQWCRVDNLVQRLWLWRCARMGKRSRPHPSPRRTTDRSIDPHTRRQYSPVREHTTTESHDSEACTFSVFAGCVTPLWSGRSAESSAIVFRGCGPQAARLDESRSAAGSRTSHCMASAS